MSALKRVLSAAADTLFAAAGAFAAVMSLSTAYQLGAAPVTTALLCLCSAAVGAALFHTPRAGTWRLLSLLPPAAYALLCGSRLVDGARLALYWLTKNLGLFTTFFTASSAVELSEADAAAAGTAFCAALGAVLALAVVFSLARLRSSSLALLVTLPVFALSMLFARNPPSTAYLLLYIAFVLAVVFASLRRAVSAERGAAAGLIALPLAFLLLLGVSGSVNKGGYEHPDWAYRLFNVMAERFPLDPVVAESVNTTSLERVDLASADPDLNASKRILRVRSDESGSLLLRGYSLGVYTGSSWERFPNTPDHMLTYRSYSHISDDFDDEILMPLTYATYIARAQAGSYRRSLEIDSLVYGNEIVYTPYYPVCRTDAGFTYASDGAVTCGYSDMPDIYSFDFFSSRDIFSGLDPLGTDWAEQNYRDDYVYKYYTDIGDGLRAYLLDFAGDGFGEGLDTPALIDAVSALIRSSCTYDLDAAKIPASQDYVSFFLSNQKSGWCMHFASAAVMMLRALGIPARYVSGYIVNVSPAQAGKWVTVKGSDAHAWAEVWVDGCGWLPVDATPSGSTGAPAQTYAAVTTAASSESHSASSSGSGASRTQRPATSAAHSSAASAKADLRPLLYVGAAIIAFCLLALLLMLRRSLAASRRRREFSLMSRSRSAVNVWRYIEALGRYGVSPPPEIHRIAECAAFSGQEIAYEELFSLKKYARSAAAVTDGSLSLPRRFVFRYIRALY